MRELDETRWFWLGQLAWGLQDWAGSVWGFDETTRTPAGVEAPLSSALSIAKCVRMITDGEDYERILAEVERVEAVRDALSRGTWPAGIPDDPRAAEVLFTETWAAARTSRVAPLVKHIELATRWKIADSRMLEYLDALNPEPFEAYVSLMDTYLAMDESDVVQTILATLSWQAGRDPQLLATQRRLGDMPGHIQVVGEDMAYVIRLDRKLERLCEAALEQAPERRKGFVDAWRIVAEHRTSLVTVMKSFTVYEVDLVRTALEGSHPAMPPASATRLSRASSESRPAPSPTQETAAKTTRTTVRNRDLDPVTISVRLRRLWTDRLGPWLEETDNDLGTVWRDTLVRRVGLTLDLVSPLNFGDGDPLLGVRNHVSDLLAEATNGHVDRVRVSFLGDAKYKQPRRAKTTDLDIFDPGDPDHEAIQRLASEMRDRVLRGLQDEARRVLSDLHVSGASRHRVWLVASDPDTASKVATTAGAAHALWDTVRRTQRVSKDPLYAIHTDPPLWANSTPIVII